MQSNARNSADDPQAKTVSNRSVIKFGWLAVLLMAMAALIVSPPAHANPIPYIGSWKMDDTAKYMGIEKTARGYFVTFVDFSVTDQMFSKRVLPATLANGVLSVNVGVALPIVQGESETKLIVEGRLNYSRIEEDIESAATKWAIEREQKIADFKKLCLQLQEEAETVIKTLQDQPKKYQAAASDIKSRQPATCALPSL